jgi:hypothetical protein
MSGLYQDYAEQFGLLGYLPWGWALEATSFDSASGWILPRGAGVCKIVSYIVLTLVTL